MGPTKDLSTKFPLWGLACTFRGGNFIKEETQDHLEFAGYQPKEPIYSIQVWRLVKEEALLTKPRKFIRPEYSWHKSFSVDPRIFGSLESLLGMKMMTYIPGVLT